jgi:hypothetical protein
MAKWIKKNPFDIDSFLLTTKYNSRLSRGYNTIFKIENAFIKDEQTYNEIINIQNINNFLYKTFKKTELDNLKYELKPDEIIIEITIRGFYPFEAYGMKVEDAEKKFKGYFVMIIKKEHINKIFTGFDPFYMPTRFDE